MKISSIAIYSVALTAAVGLIAGCSSGSGTAPSGVTPGALNSSQTVRINGLLVPAFPNLSLLHRYGAVMPDKHKKKKKKADQYMSNFYSSTVLQFDYPKSDASTGTISSVTDASGECTNVLYGVGKHDYWVSAAGSDEIEEFAYGGTTPVNTLSESTGEPAGCAFDPGTKTLAVAILGQGYVVTFANASGSATAIGDGLSSTYFDGYDAKGNLFADGLNSSNAFALVELKKGSSGFETLTTSNSVASPGQVQWDGKYITVDDQGGKAIYGYTCSGTSCTLKQTVQLSGSGDCVQTWIAKGIVFCPDATNEDGAVYKYPAGGAAVATLTGSFDFPIGAADISK
ncbi:MAG TPA: hypothetical protein VGI19_17095 [Candidatus Cybelea sp.]|jgi:hypothetical protein